MSSLITALIMAIPILFFYSSRIEKSRVVTIAKPLVITQARKTPAFDLYQQAQKLEIENVEPEIQNTTFLSTESAAATIQVLALNEMKLDRQEIGSVQDYGFQIAQQIITLPTTPMELTGLPTQSLENKSMTISVHANSSPLQKWGTVRGKFEVKDGVGVVDHIVEIKRIEEGQVRELGRVDLRAGSYSIDIENPQGYLIAQIKDHNGMLIGSDQQKIINLSSRGTYFEGPFIRVGKPAEIGANPSVVSGTSSSISASGGHIASMPRPPGSGRGRSGGPQNEAVSSIITSLFSNQHQMNKPTDKFGNISKNSSTISFIEDEKDMYSKTISIRQGADDSETPLFTKKWIRGALDYISDHQKIQFKSKQPPVLIGRVYKDGKTIRGAHVKLESDPGINAIYLDQFMIPNFNQDGTSENGYFMFVGLEANSYSAVAFENNKIIGQQVFAVEENLVSFQNISASTSPRVIIVRTFDAFSAQPVDADVMSPDVEDVIEVKSGIASYRTHNLLGIGNYVVRPKMNYMPINYIQDTRMDHVHIPALREDWLSTIQTNLQINDETDTGTVIGFVPDLEYEMYIISEGYDRKQIVYFNQLGDVTAEPTRGGGFILFNVPTGAQEIVVQEKKTERIYSQVHIVKSSQTSVSHFSE